MIREEITANNQTRPAQGFWISQPMSAVRLLTVLRTTVLEHNAKRLPKWHFRLGDDLVIQLQPRAEPSSRTNFALFRGVAIQGRTIPPGAFKQHVAGLAQMSFTLGMEKHGGAWMFSATGLYRMDPDAAVAFRDRVRESLSQLNQLDASKMFQPACLICGKKLTDPVSMARWRGPECAHTTSLNVGTWRIPTEQTEQAEHAA